MLARKIQQLMIFFSLLILDMTNEEEQMLDEALIGYEDNAHTGRPVGMMIALGIISRQTGQKRKRF